MRRDDIEGTLSKIALRYPSGLRERQLSDIPRISFHISLVAELVGMGAGICDLGGGLGLFSPACGAVGMRVTLVDDFADCWLSDSVDATLAIHREFGVRVIESSLRENPLADLHGSFDVITMFETIEHLPFGPRPLLRSAVEGLRPGGALLISAPNCVDIKRRVDCLFGRDEWSAFDEWYLADAFRGHVREPNLENLRSIAHDLGLSHIHLFGKNWWGRKGLTGFAAKILERIPSLSSTIYLVGRKTEV